MTRLLIPSSVRRIFKPVYALWQAMPGNVRGGIFMLVGACFFSLSFLLAKFLGEELHVTEILFFRQMIMLLMVLPIVMQDFPNNLKTGCPRLHVARIFFATIAMVAGFSAVIYLPLVEATTIGFSKAFFVTLFAVLFLGEKIGWRRGLSICFGFVGIVIMLRPGGGGVDLTYGLLAVLGATAAALVIIIIRKITQYDRPAIILTYQALFVGLLMLPPALYFWKTPTLDQVWLLLALGFVSYIAQMCNIHAFRAGEVTAVIPLEYTRLVYATLFGILFFSNWPDAISYLGAAIIIAAALYNLYRERKVAQEIIETNKNRPFSPLN